MKKVFRYIAKALEQKEGATDKEADKIAWIRMIILLQCVITNIFIIASCIKNLFGG